MTDIDKALLREAVGDERAERFLRELDTESRAEALRTGPGVPVGKQGAPRITEKDDAGKLGRMSLVDGRAFGDEAENHEVGLGMLEQMREKGIIGGGAA